MPKAWFYFATNSCWLVLALAPAVLQAATVLERHIHVTLRQDGTVREVSHLKIRLENEDDAASWSTHQITLYDNRTLDRLDATVTLPGGRSYTLTGDDQDTVDGAAGGFFHTSLRLHRARFRGLVPGAVLALDQEVTVRPYYPTGRVLLRGGGPVEDLEVIVDAEAGHHPEGWRWTVEGPTAGLTFEEGDTEVRVRGQNLPAQALPELTPAGGWARPLLRYGWGTDGSWRDVAEWYHDLASSVLGPTETLRAASLEHTSNLGKPRQKLDALVAFLQNKVRNVAVLIGDGNYRPSPPEDVLKRKWGDCKDKAILLIGLLRIAEIEAYPVLLHKNARGRIDPRFPSPDQFNHAIVAVPVAGLLGEVGESDPVADGYLFIDTTQTLGAGRWLDPDSQDQEVLVVRPEGEDRVRTPLLADLEWRRLGVDLNLDSAGHGEGKARLEIQGELAYELIGRIGDLAAEALAEEMRSLLIRLLPGAIVDDLSWLLVTEGIPTLKVQAGVALSGLVAGKETSRSFILPGMRGTPDPRLLRDRSLPMVLPARSARMTWNLTLPEGWCPAKERDDHVESQVGSFHQSVINSSGGRLTLDRRIELRQRWIKVGDLGLLRELALAEHRAHRRRTRLRCADESISADLQ